MLVKLLTMNIFFYFVCSEIRLRDSRTPGEGVVSLRRNATDRWRYVCDGHRASARISRVICHQLGYPRGGVTRALPLLGRALSDDTIPGDSIVCSETERRLDDCKGWDWADNTCYHSYVMGVKCFKGMGNIPNNQNI